ncbi:uncharacterized protein LOC116253147 [Nymphaea colorata]|uniref:uncharacterized protein LOC116253147 n=1 Tax=Nymphaea colorata TaxID=210225 RepID=UPI00129D7874|nr:uncharacterized protein LOC116253147 [Nymphaea colorata]
MEIIKEVGEKNVVQVVTDNAANYKAAAHCLDLILEDIAKIRLHKESIRTNKIALKNMFLSPEFQGSDYYIKNPKGKEVMRIVTQDERFWKVISYIIKVTLPLVKVLRVVDSDEKPIMGFLYNHMRRAKEEIAYNVDNDQKRYTKIWQIIDHRWDNQMHHHLHAAGYYLNPHFHYDDDVLTDRRIKAGLMECLDIVVPTVEERCDILVQLDSYENEVGEFGRLLAIGTREKEHPADWWNTFGDDTKELKNFAMRILNLTCSALGYDEWVIEQEDSVLPLPLDDSWLHSLFEIDDINIIPFEDLSRSMKKRKGASSSQKKNVGKGKTIIDDIEHESFDDEATEEEDEPIQYMDDSNDDELSSIKEDDNDEDTIDQFI